MDAQELPARPSLEQYEKLANDILEAYRSGDPGALQRIKDHSRRAFTLEELRGGVQQQLAKLRDPANRTADVSLADAQLLVAHFHGFASWLALTNHIEALNQERSPVPQFESAVDAVITGDVATLQRLLRENPELIRTRSTRVHQSMLFHYVSANGVEDFRQKTPKNIVDVAKLLLQAGAEVDAVADAYGKGTTLGLVATSVHPLVAGVQIALLETLLEAGAAVDGAPGGWNPLVAALHNGRGEAAEFLARRGARLDLEGAAGAGQLDVVKDFFNEDGSLKANATKQQMEDGFLWACEYGRTSVVEFLLEKGLDVATKRGCTGLHWAAYCAHVDAVKLLLQRKAPINVKDKNFDGTPLGWALYGWAEPAAEGRRDHYYEVVALLVAAGATVEPEWLDEKDRGMPLDKKMRADPRMLAALRGQMPR